MPDASIAIPVYSLHSVCFALFLINAGKQRYPKSWTLAIYMLGSVALTFFYWPKWDEWAIPRFFSYFLMYFVLSWAALAESRTRKLLLFTMMVLTTVVSDMVSAWVSSIALGTSISAASGEQWVLIRTVGMVSYPSNFTALSALVLARLNRLERSVSVRIGLLSVILALSQNLLLGFGVSSQPNAQELLGYAVFCEITAALNQYYVYKSIHTSVAAKASQMELEQLKQQRKLDGQYYQLAHESAEAVSRFRHDFRNQLQVAYAIAGEHPEQAAKLLGDMETQLDSIQKVHYCADPIVNAILTVKASQAQEQGIAFSARITVTDWPMEEVERSSLFSNLLDNAIEGCQRSQAAAPFISVEAAERQGFCFVRISNSCGTDVQMEGTSKAEKGEHGLGLRILQAIAQRYQGSVQVQAKDGIFTTEVVLEAQPVHTGVS